MALRALALHAKTLPVGITVYFGTVISRNVQSGIATARIYDDNLIQPARLCKQASSLAASFLTIKAALKWIGAVVAVSDMALGIIN